MTHSAMVRGAAGSPSSAASRAGEEVSVASEAAASSADNFIREIAFLGRYCRRERNGTVVHAGPPVKPGGGDLLHEVSRRATQTFNSASGIVIATPGREGQNCAP